MITEENWLLFIGSFFGVDIEWISHVTKNWNHLKNEAGCDCKFQFVDFHYPTGDPDSMYCTEWLRIRVERSIREKANDDDLSDTRSIGIN